MKILKSIAANIVGGWKTSLLGLVLFVATIVSVFKVEAVNWTDALLPILFSIGLLLMPKETKAAMRSFISKRAGIILLLILFTACKGSEPAIRSTTIKSTGTVKSIVTNTIKADQASLEVDLNQLKPDTTYEQKSERATVQVKADGKGNLTATAHCKEEVLTDTVTLYVDNWIEVPAQCNHSQPATKEESNTAAMWIWRNILWPLFLLVGAVIVIVIGSLFIKELALRLFSKPTPPDLPL